MVIAMSLTLTGPMLDPNLPETMKPEVVPDLGICSPCSAYLLVGHIGPTIGNLLKKIFVHGSNFQDEGGPKGWRQQYKTLTSRLLAMAHLIQQGH